MSLASRLKPSALNPHQVLISLLIAGLGWLSGQALSRIDQDLRIMYTEYTLGAADLAHISADVMRYRNTIIRSLEAENQKTFERITESLPGQRARIQHAVDRYAAAGLPKSVPDWLKRKKFRSALRRLFGISPGGRAVQRAG